MKSRHSPKKDKREYMKSFRKSERKDFNKYGGGVCPRYKAILWLLAAYFLVGVMIPPLIHRNAAPSDIDSCTAGQTNGTERIRCIDDDQEALDWRIRTINAAKSDLVLCTFDFQSDNSGKDMMAAMIAAARRGVRVRVLVDDGYGFFAITNNAWFKAFVNEPNISLKVYNPLHAGLPWELNYRMHEKYLIADDTCYILGGRNSNDTFLGTYSDNRNLDRDVLVYEDGDKLNNTLQQLRVRFDELWNLDINKAPVLGSVSEERAEKASKALDAHWAEMKSSQKQWFGATDWKAATYEADSITLVGTPMSDENKEPGLWKKMLQVMEQGDDVVIDTPFIMCDWEMYEDLYNLSNNSDAVEIITNSPRTGANPFGISDYLNQRTTILRTGATIYEYQGDSSMHTKTVLVDDNISIIGSVNLDMRSVYLDTEIGLIIDSPRLNAELRSKVEDEKKNSLRYERVNGKNVTTGQQAEMNIWKYFGYVFLRILIVPLRHILNIGPAVF